MIEQMFSLVKAIGISIILFAAFIFILCTLSKIFGTKKKIKEKKS